MELADGAFFPTATTETRSHLYMLEPLAKASLLLVAGTIAAIFASTLAYSLLSVGISLLCGTIALKVYSLYNEEECVNLCMRVIELDQAHPMVPPLSLMATLAMNALCPPLCSVMGVALGAYGALLLRSKQCRRLQHCAAPPAQTETLIPL